MANILFKKGLYSELQEKVIAVNKATHKDNIVDGALYLTEDEGGLYLGKKADNALTGELKRIQGSVLIFNTLQQFTDKVAPPYSQDVIYFIAESNALVRWDASADSGKTDAKGEPILGKWVVINATAADVTASLTNLDTKIGNEIATRAAEDTKLLGLINTNAENISKNSTAIGLKASQTALDAEVAERQELAAKVAENTTAAANADTKADAAQSAADAANSAAVAADAKAVEAKTAADQANANANTRVTQDEFNSFKTGNTTTIESIQSDISKNGTAINSINTSIEDIKSKNSEQDTAIAGKLSLDGSNTMTGNLDMGSKQIKNVLAGTLDNDAVNKKQLDTAISGVNTEIGKTNTDVSNLTTALNNAKKDLADTGINLTDKQITLQNNLIANGKKITGLANGENDTDAATVGQIKSAIAANDAMTFRGTLGGTTSTIASLPTTASAYSTADNHPLKDLKPQRGDTFKVAVLGEYAGVKAKVGDLFINIAADDAVPSWEHISSGYEDDYLQKLFVADYTGTDVEGVTVNITNGIGDTTAHGASVIIQTSTLSNLQFSNTGNIITASMTWGTF